jgi:uncharacterized protein YecE (DUF72 family)
MIKVGCCGFPVSKKKYFENFSVVEIQKTFYKLPTINTAQKWREEAKDKEFIVKAPQLITHPPNSPTYKKAGIIVEESKRGNYGFFRPTDEVFRTFKETKDFANALGAKLILFQTPASFTPKEENIDNLRTFMKEIDREDLLILWEPRGNWEENILLPILKELDLIHVVDPFKNKPLYGEIVYFRLHGRGKGYRYKYSDEELLDLKEMLAWEKTNYVMFNNTNMFDDALRFKRLLQSPKA